MYGIRLGAITALALTLLSAAGPAEANVKGTNGLIAFDAWTGTSQDIVVFDRLGAADRHEAIARLAFRGSERE